MRGNGAEPSATASRRLAQPIAFLALLAVLFGLATPASYATSGPQPGTTWTLATGAPDHDWVSVTFGKGRFVAVSNGGAEAVMTSTDGRVWTTAGVSGAASNTWISVTYGNNRFVALTFDHSVMTSPDGLTWTLESPTGMPSSVGWEDLTFGDGKFVAVGQQGSQANRAMVSTDGVNWTTGTINGADTTWRSVTFSSGQFVAVGFTTPSDDSAIMTSADGATWNATTAPVGMNDFAWSVTHGKDRFVAVASGQGSDTQVMTSPDASTWTLAQSSSTSAWRTVGYGGELFVAGGLDAIMTSPDGTNWTNRTNPAADSQWRSIVYANGIFVAVGDSGSGGTGNRAMYSGTYTTPSPPVTLQTPANNCVIKPKKLKRSGMAKIMKSNCKTTAGVPIRASAKARALRGDVRYFKIVTKPSGTYLRTFGHRIELKLMWRSRDTATAIGYKATKRYQIK